MRAMLVCKEAGLITRPFGPRRPSVRILFGAAFFVGLRCLLHVSDLLGRPWPLSRTAHLLFWLLRFGREPRCQTFRRDCFVGSFSRRLVWDAVACPLDLFLCVLDFTGDVAALLSRSFPRPLCVQDLFFGGGLSIVVSSAHWRGFRFWLGILLLGVSLSNFSCAFCAF